jgi:ATP-dependent DNA ligase
MFLGSSIAHPYENVFGSDGLDNESHPTRKRAHIAADWVKPQLAALVKEAPDGPGWLHEIKLDGYRMHARLGTGQVNILTRRGNDWTDKYLTVAKAIAGLPAQNAYLDGELCGVASDGRTAFNLIQNATDTGKGRLVFFLFVCSSWTMRTSLRCRWSTAKPDWRRC